MIAIHLKTDKSQNNVKQKEKKKLMEENSDYDLIYVKFINRETKQIKTGKMWQLKIRDDHQVVPHIMLL